MDLLRSTIRPRSWKDRGGPGSLQYYPLGMTLVVTQTPEVQEQVADLLAALRRLQEMEVCVEMRIVTTRPETGADLRAEFGIGRTQEPVPGVKAVVQASAQAGEKPTGPSFSGAGLRVRLGMGQRVFFNLYSTDPTERLQRMLNASDDPRLREMRKEWERFWSVDEPQVSDKRDPTSSQPDAQAKAQVPKKAVHPAFLSDRDLLAFLRLAQGDAASNVMQAPKVIMANGQHARVAVSTRELFVTEYKVVRDGEQLTVVPHHETVDVGLNCDLLPTVSADRRFVQLKFDFRMTSLDSPVRVMPVLIKVAGEDGVEKEFRGLVQQPRVQKLAVNQPFTVPDGRTMVVSLGETKVDVPGDRGPAVLRDVPFLRRFFAGGGASREAREVFVLVTPRIIINEEEEIPATSVVPR